MSELTLTVIKLGFLAVLWLLVLSVTSAMRADLFGVRPAKAPKQARQAAKAPKPSRGAPRRVVIIEGPDKDHSVPLETAPVTFGRGPECTVPLADEYVSTQHARLVLHEGQWYVEDLGSTNGTYIGSQRISTPMVVAIGVQVRVGKTIAELKK